MTSEQRAQRRRRWRLGLLSAAIVTAALGAAAVVRMGQPLTLALSLAVPTTESWLALVRADPIVEETSIDADGRRLAADVYRPATPRAGLLLVHGLSRAGRRHPELVRLARLLARHDRLVVVPHFEGLASFRLSGREVVEIRAALRALAERQRPIGVVGLSFGAGPALLAAADVPDLTLAASFGGYADLYQVIRYLTSGAHEFRDRRYTRPPEEYNRWKLLAMLVDFVRDDRDRRVLGAIAARKLADPGADTRALEADLGAAGRAVHALVLNRRDDAIGALVAALPGEARVTMEQLSPLGAVARLRGRLVIAHGVRDVSIPFTESLRLADASAGRADAVILETFEHTTQWFWPALGSWVRDARRLLSLTEALLAEPIDS